MWWSLGRYRRRLEIVADVLGVVRGGARKTQIMYQANLSYRLLTRYLRDVLALGLVRMEDEATYELTEKGQKFLDRSKEYLERRRELDRRLGKINDEKMTLVNTFLNAEDADVKNCPSKKQKKQAE